MASPSTNYFTAFSLTATDTALAYRGPDKTKPFYSSQPFAMPRLKIPLPPPTLLSTLMPIMVGFMSLRNLLYTPGPSSSDPILLNSGQKYILQRTEPTWLSAPISWCFPINNNRSPHYLLVSSYILGMGSSV